MTVEEKEEEEKASSIGRRKSFGGCVTVPRDAR
jgi:hypothetical protein